MSVKIFVGSSFGDEAKAKVVDYYSKDATMVARSAGGANAGHTVVVDDQKLIFKLIPSGILHPGVKCVLGQGMVLDLDVLSEEISNLESLGVDLENRLFISDKAHLVKTIHKKNDAVHGGKIGTTKRGIGYCYADKALRVGERLKEGVEHHNDIKKYVVPNTSYIINSEIDQGGVVYLEGAQGALLDIDHGTYPYVTSSNCTAGGACTGLGISPLKIDEVVGISKAYVTRVGNGPFPTECSGKDAEFLQKRGNEFGSVTGRPRRCGWLDLPLLKYSHMINGFTSLSLTKLDVLSGLDLIPICTRYTDKQGNKISLAELDLDELEQVIPQYHYLNGWKEDIAGIDKYENLPKNAQGYIAFIEGYLDVPIDLVSVGPDRTQTFIKEVA